VADKRGEKVKLPVHRAEYSAGFSENFFLPKITFILILPHSQKRKENDTCEEQWWRLSLLL